jgi:hypothetical protein
MSGYLSRLASNAMNPGQSIRPVVGSLFAASKYETALPGLEQETVVRVNQPDRVAEHAQEAPKIQLHESDWMPGRAHNSRDFTLATPELVPAKQQEGLEAFAIRDVKEQAETSPKEQQPQRSELEPQATEPQPNSIPANLYKPLVTRNFDRRAEAQQILPKRPDHLSDRVAKAAREPDEIQIHIGRIEVTAVPPPVSRPPARPARKSLSLDEYLKRGRR